MHQGREPRDIFRLHLRACVSQLLECSLHVEGIPEHHGIDDQAERTKLILLALPVPAAGAPPVDRERRRVRHYGALPHD